VEQITMALHYQTECRLGTRRINRSYSGYQAFVAILFDLVFGLAFELISAMITLIVRLVSLVLQLVVHLLNDGGKALLKAISLVVYVLTLPFMLLHQAVDRSRGSRGDWTDHDPSDRVRKPDWAFSREV
jgi:hypothetical protein